MAGHSLYESTDPGGMEKDRTVLLRLAGSNQTAQSRHQRLDDVDLKGNKTCMYSYLKGSQPNKTAQEYRVTKIRQVQLYHK